MRPTTWVLALLTRREFTKSIHETPAGAAEVWTSP